MPEYSLTEMDTIEDWLVNGTENPDTFVDLKWQVLSEKSENGKIVSLRVTHPDIPVSLLVLDLEAGDKNIKAIRLVVETGIVLDDLSDEDKMKVSLLLMDLAKLPLVKFYVFGKNLEVGVAVDLDKKNLTKGEFEEALGAVLGGHKVLVDFMPDNLKEEAALTELEVLFALTTTWYQKGVNRNTAYESLIKAGLNEEMANQIINSVYGTLDSPTTII